eukprot:239636-Pyramimonas_sp.AAC.1
MGQSPKPIRFLCSRLTVYVCNSKQSLDGISALVTLRELYASFNDVEDLNAIANCEYIEVSLTRCKRPAGVKEIP